MANGLRKWVQEKWVDIGSALRVWEAGIEQRKNFSA